MRKKDGFDYFVIIVLTIFFGFLLLTGEPQYLGDTFQHENQFVTREPVYALLIQTLRALSPEYHYHLVIIVQNLLAIFANCIFLLTLRKELSLKGAFILPLLAILISPHIITPLASASGMVITNSLLSEGIAYSLYLFFAIYIFKTAWKQDCLGKDSVTALCWAIIMSLVRGQFMVLILAWFIVVALIAVWQKKWSRIAILAVLLFLSFIGRGLLVKTYNYCEQGLFVGTASGKTTMVTNVLYVADREDGEAIADEKLRNMYYQVYDAAYETGLNYKASGEGLYARALHHAGSHDTLKFDYFIVAAKEYVTETTGTTVEDYQTMMVEVDRVASAIMSELLPEVLGRYIYNYMAMMMMGFVQSIAVMHPILNWYALVMYICFIVLIIFAWKMKKDSKIASSAAIVLLMITGTVTGTALMIHCLSRYVLYNLPLFYIAGLLLLFEITDTVSKRKR